MALFQILFLAFAFTAFVASTPAKVSRSTEMSPFVVGGTPSDISQFPFNVVCYFQGSFSCGGSILNEYWILTAAHCTCDKIQWGVTNRNINGPNVYNVQYNIRYPGYEHYSKDDVQLLQLDKPIDFGATAQPVKLPYDKWEVTGQSFVTPSIVLGWGRDTVSTSNCSNRA